jgi:hypothetical protein
VKPLLPLWVRVLALAAMTLGIIVSWASWQNALEAYSVERLSVTPLPSTALLSGTEGENLRSALEIMKSAHLSAVESMRWPRLMVLMALCLTAMAAGLSALRVRWPFFGKRSDAAQIAAFGALASTILRALDGAQQLAIAKRTAPALAKAMALASARSAAGDIDVETLAVGASLLQSITVMAAFTVVWRAFGSAQLQALLASADRDDADEQ